MFNFRVPIVCHVARRDSPKIEFLSQGQRRREILAEFSVTLDSRSTAGGGVLEPRARLCDPRDETRGRPRLQSYLSLFPFPPFRVSLSLFLPPSLWTPGERPTKMKECLNYEKTVVYKLTIYR